MAIYIGNNSAGVNKNNKTLAKQRGDLSTSMKFWFQRLFFLNPLLPQQRLNLSCLSSIFNLVGNF